MFDANKISENTEYIKIPKEQIEHELNLWSTILNIALAQKCFDILNNYRVAQYITILLSFASLLIIDITNNLNINSVVCVAFMAFAFLITCWVVKTIYIKRIEYEFIAHRSAVLELYLNKSESITTNTEEWICNKILQDDIAPYFGLKNSKLKIES